MKRILFVVVLACCFLPVKAQFIFSSNSSKLCGTWHGDLDAGMMKLPIVLHFTEADNGTMACTMDSPNQGAKGLMTKLITFPADSFEISISKLNMMYAARLKNDTIKGVFHQNGMNLPLVLTRGDYMPRRPQEPVKPYPYQAEEVTFSNADKTTLAGTLTYPIGYNAGEDVPVVLLVTGSGLQNRDEELMGHKPFLVIADYLARQGIASLRYDDRGFGASTGDATKATTADFAEDAASGLAFLRARGFTKIGILGLSEGASIAFMLAGKGSGAKPDFVISLAGVGVKADTALCEQVNMINKLSGINEVITTSQYRERVKKLNNAWMNYFIDYDPTSALKSMSCPIMAVNGTKDVQVVADLNLQAIQRAVPCSDKNFFKQYDGCNHLFQKCTTGLPFEYGIIEQTISDELLIDIVDWITSICK